jgi:hypothetical protein
MTASFMGRSLPKTHGGCHTQLTKAPTSKKMDGNQKVFSGSAAGSKGPAVFLGRGAPSFRPERPQGAERRNPMSSPPTPLLKERGENTPSPRGYGRAGLRESRAGLRESRAGRREGRAGLRESRAGLREGRAGLREEGKNG